jgi:hypothetical protein
LTARGIGGAAQRLSTAGFDTGFIINGAGINVTLRGLIIAGAEAPNSGRVGIDIQKAASVFIEDCFISNFTLGDGVGIKFRPTPGSHLVVTDPVLSNNGAGSTGGGIVISPQSGGTAQVVLNRVTATKNVFGIVADGTGSTGGINMTINDSLTAGNSQDGIIAVTPSGGAPIGVMVTNTKSVNNNIGIRSIGSHVTVRVKNSDVIGNGTGLSFSGGGALLTAGNNTVQANGSNASFSGSYGQQ